jgi:hypothetical protein
MQIKKYLQGNDLRSIGRVNELVPKIKTQDDFDKLFAFIYDKCRLIRMRAADGIEKLSKQYPHFLKKHKLAVLRLLEQDQEKELQWHLPQIITRCDLTAKQKQQAWIILKEYLNNKKTSKIVKVNSLQCLYEIQIKEEKFKIDFLQIIEKLKKENIPSINARMNILSV